MSSIASATARRPSGTGPTIVEAVLGEERGDGGRQRGVVVGDQAAGSSGRPPWSGHATPGSRRASRARRDSRCSSRRSRSRRGGTLRARARSEPWPVSITTGRPGWLRRSMSSTARASPSGRFWSTIASDQVEPRGARLRLQRSRARDDRAVERALERSAQILRLLVAVLDEEHRERGRRLRRLGLIEQAEDVAVAAPARRTRSAERQVDELRIPLPLTPVPQLRDDLVGGRGLR